MATLIGDIEWTRGDSYALELRLKDKSSQEYIDLTGMTLKFTVNSEKNPVDETQQLFQVEGDVYADQTEEGDRGKVSFKPLVADTATATIQSYYYDVELQYDIDSPRTLFKYRFKLLQDITK